MPGRLLTTTLVVIALAAVFAAAAYARSIVRSQNRDLSVKVAIRPLHPRVGDVIVAHVKIVNTTGHVLRDADVGDSWSTPTGGTAGEIGGTLGTGVIWKNVYRIRVTAKSPPGRYVIGGQASDGHGSSHAQLSVTLP
ncbi:MAG TPA: hypothetical protein VGL44_16460 [Gaiellales bacterium]